MTIAAIYVAARCYMADPSKITTALGRRDTNPRSDMIRITFDPRHDHLTAYTFDVNPSGVQGDMTWFDDTRSSTDYDAVWEVQTQITSDGWTAEYRIPFSQMRFSLEPGQETVWGFNIRRDIVGTAEVDRWVATPRGVNGFVSRFGHLTFADAARAAAPARVSAIRARPAGTHDRRRFRPRVVGRLGHADGSRHVRHVVGDRESRFRPGRTGPRRA